MNTRSPGFISLTFLIFFGRVSYIYAWLPGPIRKPKSFSRSYITRRTKPQQSRKIGELYSGAIRTNKNGISVKNGQTRS
jgi:hypothetical protein